MQTINLQSQFGSLFVVALTDGLLNDDREQGYRARSAFKLIQLDKKYNFLSRARCLIDLCAAPGGWLQVASKYMPQDSVIVGVDLAPIKAIPRVATFVEDITTPVCRTKLRAEVKDWKADVSVKSQLSISWWY